MKRWWIIFSIVLLLSANICQAGSFRWLDWDKDKWNSQNGSRIISKYDKIEHALGFGAIALYDWRVALVASVVWEIKDALVPWEKYGCIGGEGFSNKDLLADCIGIVLIVCLKGFVLKF